jgi:hypothetical protein
MLVDSSCNFKQASNRAIPHYIWTHQKFPDRFFLYYRMLMTSFDELLNLIYDKTVKTDTDWSCGETGCNIKVNTNILNL